MGHNVLAACQNIIELHDLRYKNKIKPQNSDFNNKSFINKKKSISYKTLFLFLWHTEIKVYTVHMK